MRLYIILYILTWVINAWERTRVGVHICVYIEDMSEQSDVYISGASRPEPSGGKLWESLL